MDNFTEHALQFADLSASSVLSVVVIGALGVLLYAAYMLKNAGTAGLTSAIHSLGDTLKQQQRHQIELETEFKTIVMNMKEITDLLRNLQTLKSDLHALQLKIDAVGSHQVKSDDTLTGIKASIVTIEARIEHLIKIVETK